MSRPKIVPKPVPQEETVTREVQLDNTDLALAREELAHASDLVEHLYGCVDGVLDNPASMQPTWHEDHDAPRTVIAADLRVWVAILYDACQHLELARARLLATGRPVHVRRVPGRVTVEPA